jgi:diaminohydroxyphosphoribosylaminopyrimidine deaminase/5-amino-6-(5-phosphoribosylamino)uracil reductase
LAGASLAVTLEPCCFTGRTGPCTKAIIAAGVRRVLVGCRDPHPRVSGRGLRALRAAGIEVVTGVLEAECREHHRGFLSVCELGRPFVSVKIASTLDGRIATASGESRWITGLPARRWVHRMRSRVDAIMVGSGTALADDPELTARRGDRVVHRPVRVLVDSRLRVPATALLYPPRAQGETWVLTRAAARGRRAIAATGARLLDLSGAPGALDLEAGLRRLAAEGLTSVLVEGGGRLVAELLRAGLVDEIHWLLAPVLLGEEARPALGALDVERLAEAHSLQVLATRHVGRDLHIHARPVGARGGSRSGGPR